MKKLKIANKSGACEVNYKIFGDTKWNKEVFKNEDEFEKWLKLNKNKIDQYNFKML